jgi:hypothetical protein
MYLFQYVLGIAFMDAGFPLAIVTITVIYSKVLGPGEFSQRCKDISPGIWLATWRIVLLYL